MTEIKVIKKSGIEVPFDINKVFKAVSKSAKRAMKVLSDDDKVKIQDYIMNYLHANAIECVDVPTMHNLVESALENLQYHDIANSYRSYRNWKKEMAEMMDDTYNEFLKIYNSDGDHENANSEETLVTTKRCKVSGYLNGRFYKKFFLTPEEVKSITEGFYYIHDRNARLDTYNCCLFRTDVVMKGGFDFGPTTYTEPHSLDAAMNLLGDIISMSAGNQYGGWTTRIDTTLAPYLEKSYEKFKTEYIEDAINLLGSADNLPKDIQERAHKKAISRIEEVLKQRFQGLELQLNSVASSRGDYPFTTFCFGLGTKWSEKMVSEWCMRVRMGGQGRGEHKKPMVFPKLVFLYDENIHGEGKINNDLFELAIECSSKAMYPDYLSLTGDGFVASVYKKYKKVIMPMGCRAYLGYWWERGGRKPADENDVPVFDGRFNLGAISLNLPMIYQQAKVEGIDFYENLLKYLEQIRSIHKRTIEYLGKKKASMSPLAFCEGGLYKGNLKPNECIAPVLKSCTISFGITALHELQMLYNGKSLREDSRFANEVMDYINAYKDRISDEDDIAYAIYGTPAESLCGTQAAQFRKKYGVIPGVSDKNYFTNSFHLNVSEDISGIEKQDKEYELFHKMNGGHIQYVRYNCNYNKDAIRTFVLRAMKLGYYEGVNFQASHCEECGTDFIDGDTCPKCGSKHISTMDRVCGYLGYTRTNGTTRMNECKLQEIADRKSM